MAVKFKVNLNLNSPASLNMRILLNTAEFKFKFDAAVATAVLPAVLSRTPGATVTIFGRNFGMGSNVPSSNSVLLNSPRYSAGTLFDSSNSQQGTAIPTALPIATLSPNLVDSMSSSARTTIGYVYLTLDAVLHQFSDTQRASVAAAIAASFSSMGGMAAGLVHCGKPRSSCPDTMRH